MFKPRVSGLYLRRHITRTRLGRDRANLSFFIVVFFFTIFGIIVITEVGNGVDIGSVSLDLCRKTPIPGMKKLNKYVGAPGRASINTFVGDSVLMMDEKGRGQGVSIRKGGRRLGDRFDYEDQNDEYPQYQDKNFDANLAAFIEDSLKVKNGKNKDDGIANMDLKLPQLNPNMTAKDAEWQSVVGVRSKFLLYSAFFDERNGRSVRLIGATKTRGPDRVWCRFWYPNVTPNKTVLSTFAVPAHVKMIRENWNLRYSACFLVCPLRQNMAAPPLVSVVARLRLPPSNLLLVRSSNKTAPTGGLAVCVKPLHFDYNKVLPFLEFIELYRILGVQHFTLYNHTIGPDVSCLIQQYQDMGVVTLLPWQLNMKSQKEIRTEGLFAALNDCLYRNMHDYAYLALVDLDEFIIPRKNGTLLDLLKWLQPRINTRNTGSFSFQNAFFYLQWEDDPSAATLEPGLVTLRKTRRKSKLHPHKQRSKYICRPELVIEAGNHFVWEFLPGYGTVNVGPDSAILHHYRVCEFGGDDCIKTANIVDRTAFRYKEKLLDVLDERWRSHGRTCRLTPGS